MNCKIVLIKIWNQKMVNKGHCEITDGLPQIIMQTIIIWHYTLRPVYHHHHHFYLFISGKTAHPTLVVVVLLVSVTVIINDLAILLYLTLSIVLITTITVKHYDYLLHDTLTHSSSSNPSTHSKVKRVRWWWLSVALVWWRWTRPDWSISS